MRGPMAVTHFHPNQINGYIHFGMEMIQMIQQKYQYCLVDVRHCK